MSAARLVALAVSGLACLISYAAADTLYLKVKDIEGDVPSGFHKGWSSGSSFQYSLARMVRPTPAAPRLSEVTVTKVLDVSSPYLFREATVGKDPKEVQIELVRPLSDGKGERYYRMKLYDALVSGYSTSGASEIPTETISFNFVRMDVTYTEYLKGSPVTTTTAWYDIARGIGGIENGDPVNTAPGIGPIAAQATQVNTPVTVPFTVSDAETAAANLTVTASSGNQTLVPNGNLTLGGSGANRTVTIQPAAGQSGQASIALRVSDGVLTGTRSFLLAVDDPNVNEPPAIIVSDPSTIEAIAGRDTPLTRLQTIDPETNQLSLTLEVINGVIRAAASAGVTISGNDSGHVVLSGVPAALNALLASGSGVVYRADSAISGTDVLTARLSDGSESVSTTLNIRIYRTQYEQWLHQQFSEAELNNPALEESLWGYHADADGDRLQNVAEYAIGSDVWTHDPISVSTDPRLSLTLKRRQDPNLTLAVEIASELDANKWSSDPAVLEALPPVDLGNGFDEVRFVDRQPVTAGGKRFMRTRWTLIP